MSAADSTHANTVYVKKGAGWFVFVLEVGGREGEAQRARNESIPAKSWMEHLEGSFHMWKREILKAGDNSELFVEGEEKVLQECHQSRKLL